MQKITTRAIAYGLGAACMLLVIYFLLLTLISGWSFAQDQFVSYWYFIVSLAIGFGIQVVLYQYIKDLVHSGRGMGKVVGVSGTTSAVTMVSCCAHYLVNLVPILGVMGVVTLVAQYQTELFWVGILLNAIGIGFMMQKIFKIKKI